MRVASARFSCMIRTSVAGCSGGLSRVVMICSIWANIGPRAVTTSDCVRSSGWIETGSSGRAWRSGASDAWTSGMIFVGCVFLRGKIRTSTGCDTSGLSNCSRSLATFSIPAAVAETTSEFVSGSAVTVTTSSGAGVPVLLGTRGTSRSGPWPRAHCSRSSAGRRA